MNYSWSKKEKVIARKAFELAYDAKCQKIIENIEKHNLRESKDIWELGNYIKTQEKQVDQLFEYAYSKFILTFALFIKEHLITIKDLDGLKEDKIKKITQILNYNP